MPLTATIKIKLRRGTLAQWTASNPVLLHGEVGIVLGEGVGETPEGIVVGNGNDAFLILWSSASCVFKPFAFTQQEVSSLETAVKNWFGQGVDSGNMIAFNSGTNEFEVVPQGNAGQFLSVDYNEPTGVKWVDLLSNGDMLKSVYDTNDNARVDAAETLRIEVVNKTGSAISKGKIVYLKSTSSSANHPEILLASATTEPLSSKTIGAVYETIPNDGIGLVVLKGEVFNADTSAYNVGDKLWLSTTAGDVQTTPPSSPNHSVFIGHVTRKQSNNGRIVYTIYNGYELGELHDVLFSSPPQQFDVLTYDGSLWVNNTIENILGFFPADSAALALKEDVITAGTTADYWRGDKTWQPLTKSSVGLANVDNTSDANKPISTATQTALNAKQDTLQSGTTIKTLEGQSLLGSGNIDLSKSDVGLSNVDNTSDANKPISTATQTALNAKENTIASGTTSQYFRGDKTFQTLDKNAVGLGNVDNTSDANKPVSTATQTALNAKQDTLVSGTTIKTLEGQSLLGSGNIDLTKSDVGLSNVDNTSDANKPVSTATQTALNAKQNSLTLTTTGTSGAATLVGSTLNIPQYSGGGGGGITQSDAIAYAIALG